MKQITYILITALIFISSCANYKLNYSREGKKWETNNQTPTDKKIRHTMYMIGGTGNASSDDKLPSLELLKTKLAEDGENSSVIFLGNNVSTKGMPNKADTRAYELGKSQVDAQLEILKDYEGRVIFLPGENDWSKYGLKGVKRQQKYIEKNLNADIEEKDDWDQHFYPEHGCSGPEIVEINDQLIVVIVDSQWYLTDWDTEPAINDDCEVKSRKDFGFHFEEIVRKYRNKNVVIAMHHPMFSYGPYGGHFGPKEHLLPVPVLGSLNAFYRNVIGTKSDLSHKNYKEFKSKVLTGASKNGSFIFAAAHEQNLQYIYEERQHHIIAGSGSKASASKAGKGSEFAYAKPGFAQLDFYEDGSAWVQFWITDGTEDGKIVFRKKLKDKLEISEENIPTSFPEYEENLTTKFSPLVSNKVVEKGGLHYFFMGEHFRNLYSRTFEFPVLDLETFKGGMTPIKRGGGNQTNSLRLEDADGKQWVMRSLTKDASRTVPYPINKMTAAEGIVQETFLSSHPFAALAVPPLASAVNVYHTNPKLYYIPKQPALGVHNDLFGGEVYLVEERAGGNWKEEASLGNSKKLISTIDLAEKVTRSHKHKVDQEWLLRSRLFDQVIGDWDRHDDQWRWATIKINKDSITYRAIPRDRDQPFSKYDGLLIKCAKLFMPFLKQLKEYKGDIKNMKWSSWSPKYVDNSFLNEMDWEDWEREAKYIQENMTDEVIDEAFKVWPEKAQELTAEEIKSVLKQRRDNLVKFARMHYELLYKKADVYGTDKDERFEIDRLDNENTRIRIYHKKKEGDRLVFDRVFQRSVTKEISVYGLGDDDEFNVRGKVKKGILIRLIGGQDKDKFVDESKVAGLSKKTKIYDNKKKNKYELGSEAKDLSSTSRDRNIYDRRHRHYEYNFTIPLPILGFNPDDGFFLGANFLTTLYGFKKVPYSSFHNFTGSVAFATGGIDAAYTGDFVEAIGTWNFQLDATYRSDRFAFSFYGLGNNSELTTDDFDFNRVRQNSFSIYPAIKKPFSAFGSGFTVGPIFERSFIEETAGRFITEGETNLSDEIFDAQAFAGAKVGLDVVNKDNLQIPTRGARFMADASWMTDLNTPDNDFTLLNAELTIYQNIDQKANLVLATRVGAGHRIGDYPFFHSATLGGNTNLRGYRAERFYGNTSFYHSTDLRLKLFNSVNKILPFTLGVMGGVDYGRVWLDGEDSDTWHNGYGGGIWIAPVDLVIFNFTYFKSDEENRMGLRLGFDF